MNNTSSVSFSKNILEFFIFITLSRRLKSKISSKNLNSFAFKLNLALSKITSLTLKFLCAKKFKETLNLAFPTMAISFASNSNFFSLSKKCGVGKILYSKPS